MTYEELLIYSVVRKLNRCGVNSAAYLTVKLSFDSVNLAAEFFPAIDAKHWDNILKLLSSRSIRPNNYFVEALGYRHS